ncbi:MAG: hypothetical protein KAW46_02830, partial [candidate division Zixibacteria bacterium]|nr:hypothetical protein [candidate division Zixibacteria bacterium]
LGACKEEQLSRQSVITVLDSLEHKLEWLDYRLAVERWDYFTEGKSDSLEFFEQLYNHVLTDEQDYGLLRRGSKLLTDETDQRRAELILSRLQVGRIEFRPEVIALRRSLGYSRVTSDGVIGTSLAEGFGQPDRSTLDVDPRLPDAMGRLIRLRNQLARREGFNSYFALSMKSQGMDVREYLSLLERLDKASHPRYRQVLDSMALKRGGSGVTIGDLSILLDPFRPTNVAQFLPMDSQFAFVKRSLAVIGFDLNRLPIYFQPRQDSEMGSPLQCLPIRAPHDVRIWGDHSGGMYGTCELLRQIGHALHWTHVAQEQPVFGSTLHPIWRESVAQVFAYMCEESIWLEKYAHVPSSLIERYRREQQNVEVVRLRWMLTHLMFEYEAYTGSNRDFDKLYWDMVEKFLLVPRHDEAAYWATVGEYASNPVQLHCALFGKIVAAQTLAYLEKQYGGLVDNPEAYSFLVQNYMRFGSRYHWQDLLQRGTGEKLNSGYYLARLGL